MAKNTVSNLQILQALYPKGAPITWDDRISIKSKEYWEVSSTLIASQNFKPLRNEIFNELLNRIGLEKINQVTFKNPLEMFKSTPLPFGDTVENIGVDVLTERKFSNKNEDQFEKNEADVRASYHRINRESYYTVTVSDAQIKRAFLNQYGLQNLLDTIISRLTDSNVVDEYLYTKRAIESILNDEKYPMLDTQKVAVPDVSALSPTTAQCNAFLAVCKKLVKRMTFANRNYNCTGLTTQVSPKNLCIVLLSDISANLDINVLSKAFNPQFVDVNIPIIEVDKFSDPNIVGVIMERETVEIHDTLREMRVSENARALYYNYFFHIHQLYMANPFKNIIYLTKEMVESGIDE